MIQLALIAPTASGKTDLSLSLAHKLDAVVLSLDSLSVYKHIDIASAKPTNEERDGIVHFGIDCITPDQNFDVIEFIAEYEKTKLYCKENRKNLIIVGGTSFYLKSLTQGLSCAVVLNQSQKNIVKTYLQNLQESYDLLNSIDKEYMQKIEPNDKYRIEKALEIYVGSNLSPSEFFKQNPPKPIIENLPIFQIETQVDILRKRIELRTAKMIKEGIIDEVIYLERNYTRAPNCMKSIGIKETLEYLDGKIDKKMLQELITIHTAQLAKRQRTFNKSQFENVVSLPLDQLENRILQTING